MSPPNVLAGSESNTTDGAAFQHNLEQVIKMWERLDLLLPQLPNFTAQSEHRYIVNWFDQISPTLYEQALTENAERKRKISRE